MSYASFWKRSLARIIDYTIIIIFSYAVVKAIYTVIYPPESHNYDSYNPGLDLIDADTIRHYGSILGFFIFHLIYYPIFEWKGNRLGKILVGIKTVSIYDGNKITLWQSYIRSIGSIIPLIELTLLFDKEGQTVYDYWGKTTVVNN